MTLEKQLCDQCDNQCPVDALKCGKGRRHFGLESKEDGKERMGREMPKGPIGQLRQCGHLLHHGGVSGDDLLSALNSQEQAELERLLGTLLADWQARANSESHRGHHHGERE